MTLWYFSTSRERREIETLRSQRLASVRLAFNHSCRLRADSAASHLLAIQDSTTQRRLATSSVVESIEGPRGRGANRLGQIRQDGKHWGDTMSARGMDFLETGFRRT
jgi:hypothetical protein